MAGTMVSASTGAMSSLLAKLTALLSEEYTKQKRVRRKIETMRDELGSMNALLVKLADVEGLDGQLKQWRNNVRELAYDMEDCIDVFMLKLPHSDDAKNPGVIKKMTSKIKRLWVRHQVANQIEELTAQVKEVSERRSRYKFDESIVRSATPVEIDPRLPVLLEEARGLVGIDGPRDVIIGWLMDGEPQLKVVSIVGFGGLGKTTLAMEVYRSLGGQFHYKASTSVSRRLDLKKLTKDILSQLEPTQYGRGQLEMLEVEQLIRTLREYLQDKRYLIVIDDVWSESDWGLVKSVLPQNSHHSRVITTTRISSVAKSCSSDSQELIHEMKPLNEVDSRKLFMRRIFHPEDGCPSELEDVMNVIIKKCGGLPLAIITISSLLSTKPQIREQWERVKNGIGSSREEASAQMKKILLFSYYDLPYYLKTCLLYVSMFPEDHLIQRQTLIWKWIAEGLVDGEGGLNLEEVGDGYFNELMNRSMILQSGVNIEGNVKSCRVHDIMRDVIVSISREENFAYFIQGNGSNLPEENFRHVAYHGKFPEAGMDLSHIRSLTFFAEGLMDLTPSVRSPKLRMLRVLDLVGGKFRITQNGMNSIMLLYHLKYLNVRTYWSVIYSLPSSIGNIKGLQILDMGDCYISTLPTEVTELRNLRSFRCNRSHGYQYVDPGQPMECLLDTLCLPITLADSQSRAKVIANLHMGCSSRWSRSLGVKVPKGIGNLKELQVLETVDIRKTSSKAVKELAELTQLRKLAVATEGATKEKCKILCASIEKLSHLRSLKLHGYIGEMTDWFRNLTQLVKIYLAESQLKEDRTMEILGELPKLMLLRMRFNAYLGEKVVFGNGAFLNLRKLEIWDLKYLTEMRFEEGTSPLMEMIEIRGCQLATGIIGIKHLRRLKQISLGYGSKVARLGMLEEEVNAHPNHPVLRLAEDRKYHDLGGVGGSIVEVEATESIADNAGQSSQVITLPMTDMSSSSVSEIQPASS